MMVEGSKVTRQYWKANPTGTRKPKTKTKDKKKPIPKKEKKEIKDQKKKMLEKQQERDEEFQAIRKELKEEDDVAKRKEVAKTEVEVGAKTEVKVRTKTEEEKAVHGKIVPAKWRRKRRGSRHSDDDDRGMNICRPILETSTTILGAGPVITWQSKTASSGQ
ncbi:hypothetical protein TIFTF001_000456 [Ficus carica]|uniref:Uncharacterized protein n=1 Tax=Ficus carica TaxID=3494 RepID=A0AA88CJY8_FICCA|nr:hypothetical protein TIFTF001_000456 [Ficus carica]